MRQSCQRNLYLRLGIETGGAQPDGSLRHASDGLVYQRRAMKSSAACNAEALEKDEAGLVYRPALKLEGSQREALRFRCFIEQPDLGNRAKPLLKLATYLPTALTEIPSVFDMPSEGGARPARPGPFGVPASSRAGMS